MPAPDVKNALAGLLRTAGLDVTALNDVTLTGSEPALPSSFAVGTAAQTTIAASALAAAELWRQRTGGRQHVSVDLRHAAIEFRSERYLRIDGKPYKEYHDDLAGLYRCGDGRWARLHTNLPHHCSGLLELLNCPHDKAAVQRALAGMDGGRAGDGGSGSRASRHRVPHLRGVGQPSAGASNRSASRFHHRTDRRRSAYAAWRGRTSAERD